MQTVNVYKKNEMTRGLKGCHSFKKLTFQNELIWAMLQLGTTINYFQNVPNHVFGVWIFQHEFFHTNQDIIKHLRKILRHLRVLGCPSLF